MIRLRAMLERGLAHPWLGPVLLLLIALLLSFLALHPAIGAHFEAASVCAAIALLALIQVFLPMVFRRSAGTHVLLRAPPSPRAASDPARLAAEPVIAPLRL